MPSLVRLVYMSHTSTTTFVKLLSLSLNHTKAYKCNMVPPLIVHLYYELVLLRHKHK